MGKTLASPRHSRHHQDWMPGSTLPSKVSETVASCPGPTTSEPTSPSLLSCLLSFNSLACSGFIVSPAGWLPEFQGTHHSRPAVPCLCVRLCLPLPPPCPSAARRAPSRGRLDPKQGRERVSAHPPDRLNIRTKFRVPTCGHPLSGSLSGGHTDVLAVLGPRADRCCPGPLPLLLASQEHLPWHTWLPCLLLIPGKAVASQRPSLVWNHLLNVTFQMSPKCPPRHLAELQEFTVCPLRAVSDARSQKMLVHSSNPSRASPSPSVSHGEVWGLQGIPRVLCMVHVALKPSQRKRELHQE